MKSHLRSIRTHCRRDKAEFLANLNGPNCAVAYSLDIDYSAGCLRLEINIRVIRPTIQAIGAIDHQRFIATRGLISATPAETPKTAGVTSERANRDDADIPSGALPATDRRRVMSERAVASTPTAATESA